MARLVYSRLLTICALGVLGACEPSGEVRIQELPPLALPSPERRAGLPEVAGVWRFVGFALPPVRDTLAPAAAPVPPGPLAITTQRMDSLAGFYQAPGGRVPLTGEVRRDGVVSLVAFGAEGGRFAAGRIARDTLWIELTSFGVAQSWPNGTRAAFSRRPPAPRPPPAPAVPTAVDTTRPDSLARDTSRVPVAAPAVPPPALPAPRRPVPTARPAPVPVPTPPPPRPVVPQPVLPDTASPAPPDTTGRR